MKTIISPDTEYRRFFPPFPPSPLYRRQQFCIRKSIDCRKEESDASLLFNILSGELVLLDREEDELWCGAEDDNIVPDNELWSVLAAHDFVVPQGTDMIDVLQKGRAEAMNLINTVSSMRPGYFRYTVFTTTDCNARCFYCYQKGSAKLTMSPDIALATARFFEKNYRENETQIKIHWFGGEPLLNCNAMDIITGYLASRHIPFCSTMTSNGYLFTQDIQRKAIREWRLRKIQITLDGTERTYNSCKAYIYPGSECESPFRRVFDNIASAAGNGIDVNVRMNVDSHNADNLLELLDLFKSRGEELKGHIRFYPHSLYEDSPHPDQENRAEALFEYISRIEDRISALWPAQGDADDKPAGGMLISYCMVDNLHSLTVLPDGEIGKCEHHTSDMFVGSVEDGVDKEAVATMVRFNDYFDRCRNCPFPPRCFHLKMCVPDYSQECRFQILRKHDDALRKMQRAYEDKQAYPSPAEIVYLPKIPQRVLNSAPLEVLSVSHCKYAVRGRNGNCLSIRFVSALELGSHSIQSVKVGHIGGRRKYVRRDDLLLKTLAFVLEAYLREHKADIILFSDKLSGRGEAIHRFIRICFRASGACNAAELLQYEGDGVGGGRTCMSLILLRDCPQFREVCEALSEQLDEIAINNDEVMNYKG